MSVTCLQRRNPPPILTGFSFTCSVNTQTANHCYQYNTFSLCNQEAECFLIGQSERKNSMRTDKAIVDIFYFLSQYFFMYLSAACSDNWNLLFR